jgi:cytosine/creatinine deaminase
MTDLYEVLVQNARLRQQNHGTVDIGISGGRIAEIAARLDGEAAVLIDAEGCLVTESFVNPHLHLCKEYTLDKLNDEALKSYYGDGMGSAMHAIELAARVKEQLDCESMLINLRTAVSPAAIYRSTRIRAQDDISDAYYPFGLNNMLEVVF